MPTDGQNAVIDHRRALQNMLDDLKRVQILADELDLAEVRDHAATTRHRVENDFFKIAVVGEFKRGKSTLINALLGKEILPADVLPCSATLNRVTYGTAPQASIIFKADEAGDEKSEEIPFDQLKEYVTKLTDESEARASSIKEAVVYYPTPYCRDKADIIDTPGLNDDDAMTSVTLSVLAQVDAAIMMVMAQSPFAGTEGDFLNNRMLTNDIGRVLFVANRIDQVDEEDRDRVLASISDRIQKSVRARAAELYGDKSEEFEMFIKRVGKPKVFGVSAKQALKAKVTSDTGLLERSGFPEFEAALEHFLTFDKGNVTLQVLAECTVGTSTKVLLRAKMQEGALTQKQDEFEAAHADSAQTLHELRDKYEKELGLIDAANERTFGQACLHLDSLEESIKGKVGEVVEAARLTVKDIEGPRLPATQSDLGKKIEDGVRQVVQQLGEQLQTQIEREIISETTRLQGFALAVSDALSRIEFRFQHVGVSEDNSVGRMATGTALGAFAPLPIGGFFTGYQEGGLKGAGVGGGAGLLAGLATFVGGGVLLAVFSLPLTFPVMLPILLVGGFVSAFTGKKVVQHYFSQDRVDTFKTQYQAAIIEEITRTIGSKKYEFIAKLREQVDMAFNALRKRVHTDLGSSIEETQRTLDDLHAKRARSQAEQEIERKRLSEIRLELEKIQSRALAKSKDLREITSV